MTGTQAVRATAKAVVRIGKSAGAMAEDCSVQRLGMGTLLLLAPAQLWQRIEDEIFFKKPRYPKSGSRHATVALLMASPTRK